MSGLGSLLYTARDALLAQSYGLNVTGQNIANATTPGYVRRQAILETQALGTETTGTVHAAGLRRVTDRFLERGHLESVSLSAAAEERDSQLTSLEALFNDSQGTGIGSSLESLYTAFGTLANNPADSTARATVLSAADTVAARIHETSDQMVARREQMLQAARATADDANRRAQEIAKLDQQIAMAEAKGADAADLKDRRDQTLLGLADLVDVRTFTDGSGNLVVQSLGTTLVEGGQARTLSVDLDADGQLRVLAQAGNGPETNVTAFVVGGKLGGIREARDQDLTKLTERFDQFVFDVFGEINRQHAQGFGLDGVNGRALFTLASGPTGAAASLSVEAGISADPDFLAASSSLDSLPGGGDNALELFGLARKALDATGTTPSDAYAALVGDLGVTRQASRDAVEMRAAIQAQAETMRQSVSGVSVEEEMVSLTQFQRAYEAGAKVLNVADQLLKELMETLGR
jgi:flagellar hook-associated protein 1 FlgK